MTDTSPIVVWFRDDLRISDNSALYEASLTGRPVVAQYIFESGTDGRRPPGSASRWWLHHSLDALAEDLASVGGQLILRTGNAAQVLNRVIDETGAGAVYWNRRYDPLAVDVDRSIKTGLAERGVETKSFNASLLYEPWTVQTKAGGFYKVYTRFWHACREKGEPEAPVQEPESLIPVAAESENLDDWALLPRSPDWAGGIRERWKPGAASARERLDAFLDEALDAYGADRDFPARPATSNLSPHLRFGEIGPREVWHAAKSKGKGSPGLDVFLKELVWREFTYHVSYHLPDMSREPMYDRFRAFPWRDDADALEAWQRGRTGYPMVDAGMRELWQTGYMHNRVRMITGSFLVKHLLLPWQKGEQWFWDTLVDADPAANTFNWQWVAGCGADAAPYFRIFNPMTQGAKFDPNGTYIRAWVPEIAQLPDKHLNAPWEAPEKVLSRAGVRLGETYPEPIVGHKAARERALEAFRSLP